MDPFLTTCGIHVYHIDLKSDATREQQAEEKLNAQEQAQMRRYRVASSRRQYLLVRACLRKILCDYLGCENARLHFEHQLHGKPQAWVDKTVAPISFNVSHSGEHGVIAVSSRLGPIGVDVEVYRSDRNLDKLSARLMSVQEQAALSQIGADERVRQFYRLWTLKEAMLKAMGTGLTISPASFEIPEPMIHISAHSGSFRFPSAPGDHWALESFCEDRFAGALAWQIEE